MKNIIAYIVAILIITNVITSNYTSKEFYNSIKNMPVDKQFNLWASFNSKDYVSKEEEKQLKFNNFKENLHFINEQNSKNESYTLGLGPFSDLNYEDFKNLFSNPIEKPNAAEIIKETTLNKEPFLPFETKDWSMYFNIKDSKQCFSGADSIVSLMEFNLKTSLNVNTSLSAQSYVDCYLSGCQNYGANSLLEFFTKNGAYEEKDYPFTGEKGVCFFQRETISNKCDFTPPFATIQSSKEINLNNADDYIKILNQQPILIYLVITPEIQNYRGGVLPKQSSSLSQDKRLPVILVQMTDKFVKLLPSFGKSYGENGYLRIEYARSEYSNRISLGYGQYIIEQVKLNKS